MAMTQRRVAAKAGGRGVFDCAARKAGRGGAGDPPANTF